MKKYKIGRNLIYISVATILFIAIYFAIFFIPNFRSYDIALLQYIQGIIVFYPVSLAHAVSTFGGDYYLLWPQLTALSALFSHKKYFEGIMLVIFTQTAWRGGDLIKDIFQRERPCGDAHAGYSFPSCHALTTMCFYGIVLYLIHKHVHNKFWKYTLTVLLSAFIILVCFARLKLNVHFVTDVTAGLFAGIVLLNIYIIINKIFNKENN